MGATPGDQELCSICLDDGEDSPLAEAPCECRGTGGLVHPQCLQRWRAQFPPSDPRHRECMQCRRPYTVVCLPEAGGWGDFGGEAGGGADFGGEAGGGGGGGGGRGQYAPAGGGEAGAEEGDPRVARCVCSLVALALVCQMAVVATVLYAVSFWTGRFVSRSGCELPDRCQGLLVGLAGAILGVFGQWRRCRHRLAVVLGGALALAPPDRYAYASCLTLAAVVVQCRACEADGA